jgi:xanthine dehydrogenase accessory factor
VSITAELLASRNRAARCIPLRDSSGPIHRQPAPGQPRTATPQEIAWT